MLDQSHIVGTFKPGRWDGIPLLPFRVFKTVEDLLFYALLRGTRSDKRTRGRL